MTSPIFKLPQTDRPMFQRLAEAIRSSIQAGLIKSGERLPSTRELAARYKVHRHTIMNGIGELVAEGWIESHNRSHYRVAANLPTKFLRVKNANLGHSKSSVKKIHLPKQFEVPTHPDITKMKHAFPSGFPDIRLFPAGELKSCMYDALSQQRNFSYGEPEGSERLIRQIEIYLRHARGLKDRKIVVTNGSQEAIFLLVQLLIEPGDAVAIDALTYPPVVAALRFAGAELVPVELDTEGLSIDHLEKILQTKRIKLLYTTPLHQYPTSTMLGAGRRLRLCELASRYGFKIIEDDYDHEFHYDNEPSAPLATLDVDGSVLYVSTFSKILFPGARLGFAAIPESLASELAKLKRISSRQNEGILQDAVARWMEDGGFERHLRRMRRVYETRRNAMIETLEDIQNSHPKLSWHTPAGGMALWVNLGKNSDNFAKKAFERSVYVTPESWYRMDKKPGTHLRIGFSGQTPEENHRGLHYLFHTIP